MADPKTREALQEEMQEYFFGENARVPEGWVEPGQGGGAKGGGAPAAKGGGAPRKG